MKTKKHEKNNLKKIKEFEKNMLEAAEKGKLYFEFCGKRYQIIRNDSFVQTLIDDRILYRISLDENKNTEELANNLANCTDDFFIAN